MNTIKHFKQLVAQCSRGGECALFPYSFDPFKERVHTPMKNII